MKGCAGRVGQACIAKRRPTLIGQIRQNQPELVGRRRWLACPPYFRSRHCKRAMLRLLEPIQRSEFQQRAQPWRRRCPMACGISPKRRAIRGRPADMDVCVPADHDLHGAPPGTAHELLDLTEKYGLEFLLRVMFFNFRAGLFLDFVAQIGIVD